MAKITLSDLANITGQETSAIAAINANNSAIETAIENTLSRDGTSPNAMNADFDMNGNDIINVGLINGVDVTNLVGEQGPQGEQGIQGDTGPQGVGVSDAEVVGDDLIITLTDATEINAGDVRGPQGDTGLTGATGATGPAGADGTDGIMASVVAGTGIDVDSTDPANPVVSIESLTVSSFNTSAIVTEAEGISSNDNDSTIPTSAAVKDYVDNATPSITFATNAQALQATSTTLSVNPANLANLYSIALSNAIEIADLKGSRLNMAGGIADAYDSETDVDTATSTNESYDSGNDLYSPSMGTATTISGATGTNIGDMTSGGGLAGAFDGTTNQSNAASAQRTGTVANAYVGKNYSASPKRIAKADIYPSNADHWFSAADGAVNVILTLYGKNGSPPSSHTDGTSLGTTTFSEDATSPRTITSNDTTTSWDYVWMSIATGAGSTGTIYCAELVLYEPGTPNNMTLVSKAFTATAVPTVARIAAFIDPQESITINTNFTAEASRDGGTTWTMVTLALVSNPVGTVEQYEGTVSISAQPSGSSMKYRLKTLNNKDIDVTGTVFQWG
jgi:hypothetical protein